MCADGPELTNVKITRCVHGHYHVYLGKQTLHLSVRELLLLACELNRVLGVVEACDENEPEAPPLPEAGPSSDRWPAN
ncbi:MAG: hypothetical protein GC162_05360 [Planctomycetes bacterium]|nr:hypothetical protein [Planctomycetota bacterium]